MRILSKVLIMHSDLDFQKSYYVITTYNKAFGLSDTKVLGRATRDSKFWGQAPQGYFSAF